MQTTRDNMVLIADDDAIVGKAMVQLVKHIGAACVYVQSGREALERIKAAQKPFSLIISDQQMPGIKGSELLEQAKEITPDTIRFLITGYEDMDAATEAVNKGAIHRYISKPWDAGVFSDTIKAGLEQHATLMENHRFFTLAKQQNARLYKFNLTMKESADRHQKDLLKKNERIAQLTARIEKEWDDRDHMDEIRQMLMQHRLLDQAGLNVLHTAMTSELYRQFQAIAVKNAFDMPENIEMDS